RAINAEFGTSKKKSTSFVLVNFEITQGEHAGEILSWNGYFTTNTEERTIESLRYCGCEFPGNDITDLTGIHRSEVQIVVEHEEYQTDSGETKTAAKVAWVNSLGRTISVDQRMDDAAKAAFKARMMGRVVKSKQSMPASSSTTSTATPAAKKNGG